MAVQCGGASGYRARPSSSILQSPLLRAVCAPMGLRTLQRAAQLPSYSSRSVMPPQRLPLQARRPLSAAHVGVATAVENGAEAEPEGEYCMPSQVEVDNVSHEAFTVLTLEVKDYPGLFRVVAWVLNGLELDVHNATLETDAAGMVRNSFWLKDVAGRKLADAQAVLVSERLQDFVTYCTPDDSAMLRDRFGSGPISVDNAADERYSVVTIIATKAQQERVNFLLELASALNGVGVKIGRAQIQSCRECGTPVADPDFPTEEEGGRLYKIWGTDRHGKKLEYARITALLYTINLVFDKTSISQTSVPSGMR